MNTPNKGNVVVNPFVQRQTKDSQFSYFDGPWSELIERVASPLEVRPGYKDGVLEVDVSPDGFYSGVVKLEGGEALVSRFAPRERAMPGEFSALSTVCLDGKKMPAAVATVILYHRSILDESQRAGLVGEWHVISINARVTEGPEPPHPLTMYRNWRAGQKHPDGVGGTPADYTVEEIMEALGYWKDKVMVAPGPASKRGGGSLS